MPRMNTKSTKYVVLGVTGSIAAYKACEIASTLTQNDIHVTVVLTKAAQNLVGAATFEGLTGNRVITDMFDPVQNADIEHIAVLLHGLRIFENSCLLVAHIEMMVDEKCIAIYVVKL